jgi:threonine-phosphate decarboxylase
LTELHAVAPPTVEGDPFSVTSHSPSLIELVGFDQAEKILDFCFIANPYYPTPAMMQSLQDALPRLVKYYPSSNPATSQRHLAEVLHVDPANLIIGNGATELIVLANRVLVDRIAVPVPTFGEYIEKLRDESAAELFQLPPDRGFQLDLGRYLAWARRRDLKALLVINPGNPTGQLIGRDEMLWFLKRAEDMDLVIVDESFIDFAGDPVPSLLPMADRFANLLIVRSMSKHCGVPGLRLGYSYTGNKTFLRRIRRFVPTWNLNTLAEYFLTLLASTDAEYQASRRQVAADTRWLYEALGTIPGLTTYPTGANFVLFKLETGTTAAQLQARLLRDHRMYVRDCSNKIGIDDRHVRVASQGRDRDARLIDALRVATR